MEGTVQYSNIEEASKKATNLEKEECLPILFKVMLNIQEILYNMPNQVIFALLRIKFLNKDKLIQFHLM